MMSRSTTSALAGRASSMRRLRRRASAASASSRRPFCSTNGCASFLEVDAPTGIARCPVCGFVRRTHSSPTVEARQLVATA